MDSSNILLFPFFRKSLPLATGPVRFALTVRRRVDRRHTTGPIPPPPRYVGDDSTLQLRRHRGDHEKKHSRRIPPAISDTSVLRRLPETAGRTNFIHPFPPSLDSTTGPHHPPSDLCTYR